MKNLLFPLLICAFCFCLPARTVKAQKIAVFSYPVEIELTNDEADMSAKDYLKNYGTKGIKRGNEYVYQIATPFIITRLAKAGLNMLPVDTLNSVKANEYGKPAASLPKAIASGIADQYMKIYIKDITPPAIADVAAQDPSSQQRKLIKVKCRIQIYDTKKVIVKDVEGMFQSGEKIENPAELGVDLRKYAGTEFLQELKIYESCTKMAIIRAIAELKK